MTGIDVHTHCVPDEVVRLLDSEGKQLGIEVNESGLLIAGRVQTQPLRADLTDISARLDHMDRTGIETQLLSSWVDLTAYSLDPDRGRSWSRRVNEALAGEAARYPQRFGALATVPLQSPEGAAAELRYAARELGMVGVEIGTTIDGADLVSGGLDEFWKEAARLRSLVLLHPLSPLPGIDLSAYFLHNSIGRPAETTIAISRLLMAGVLDAHPHLTVCAVHGGGFLPFQIGRLQRSYEVKPAVAAKDAHTAPRESFKSLYFDTVLHSPGALRYLIDLVGADRVLLGSDYPFEMGDPDPRGTLDLVEGLDADQREAISSGNARRLISQAAAAAA